MRIDVDRSRWLCLSILFVVVLAYVITHSLQEVAIYYSGHSLFDLAVYEQGFWNALGDPPFFYSLEGPMSRFGRHFSPIFYLILPFFLVYSDPVTLLVLQTVAIGLGAIPVYLLGARRFGRPAGVLLGIAYLLNPAVHDVNVKNDFHEISFALPTLLLQLYFAERRNLVPYMGTLLLALSTREEVSVTTFLLGLYFIVFRRDTRMGGITAIVSLVWGAAVLFWVMPAFNATKTFPVAAGYEYLGSTPLGILTAGIKHPLLVFREMTGPAKLAYLFWLAEPVAFFCVLAPEVMSIASAALVIVLASTYPHTYEIFERYAAPIVPFVLYAGIVGIERIRFILFPSRSGTSAVSLASLVLVATAISQVMLWKLPVDIRFTPDARTQATLAIVEHIPPTASVSAEDHRWLAHLANRRELYALGPGTPDTDFVLFDRKREPITNIAPGELRRVEDRFLSDPAYRVLRCDSGLFLLGRRMNELLNRAFLDQPETANPSRFRFGSSIWLYNEHTDPYIRAGSTTLIDLSWHAADEVADDFHVFVHLVDSHEKLVAQHDGVPGDGHCSTKYWASGLTVADRHPLMIPASASEGDYHVNIGLYRLQTMERLPVFDVQGNRLGDHVSLLVQLRS